MVTFLGIVGSVVLTGMGFMIGRFYAESERILAQKRRVYEEYLRTLPTPNSAYDDMDEAAFLHAIEASLGFTPVLLLYASGPVATATSIYLNLYEEASRALSPDSPPLAPEYLRLARAQNDIIFEMRRDAFAWSVFIHRGKSRVPLVPSPRDPTQ